jgi:hypothetical protein
MSSQYEATVPLRRPILALLIALGIGCAEKATNVQPRNWGNPIQAWKRLMNGAVNDQGVNYAVFRNRPRAVLRYLNWAGHHGQHSDWWGESKEDKRIAHLANTYNAAVIHAVIEYDPTDSVDEIQIGLYRWPGAGFKYGLRYRVDGEWVNLHRLSQVDTVSRYQEPLLWVMFHDGTQDAPPLRWWPSKGLQAAVKKAMRAFLASDKGLSATATGWAANPLFFEREKDFLEWHDAPNLCAWMVDYTSDEREAWMRAHATDCTLERRPPNRALNDAPE